MAANTDCAEVTETSCSQDLPPNSKPTLIFLDIAISCDGNPKLYGYGINRGKQPVSITLHAQLIVISLTALSPILPVSSLNSFQLDMTQMVRRI